MSSLQELLVVVQGRKKRKESRQGGSMMGGCEGGAVTSSIRSRGRLALEVEGLDNDQYVVRQ